MSVCVRDRPKEDTDISGPGTDLQVDKKKGQDGVCVRVFLCVLCVCKDREKK